MISQQRRRRAWQLPDLPLADVPPPHVDTATMAAVDRIATDTFNLSLLQMMENAGRGMATLAFLALDGPRRAASPAARVLVLAGTGNNAGGGLVAARHLASWGVSVDVVFARPVMRLRPVPCQQLDLALASGVSVAVAGHDRSYLQIGDLVRRSDLVIDALIGYTLRGAPDDAYRPLIDLAGVGEGPLLSLDLPSGVDATSGQRPGAAIAADCTLTLALPKTGLLHDPGRTLAGQVYLADIGIPRGVFNEAGVDVPVIFSRGPLIRLADRVATTGAGR